MFECIFDENYQFICVYFHVHVYVNIHAECVCRTFTKYGEFCINGHGNLIFTFTLVD